MMTLIVSGQEFQVRSFRLAANDISAVKYQRLDLNGQPCALIKVGLGVQGAKFPGTEVVGDVKFDTGEYWVYVVDGTKKLKVMHNNYAPLYIDFSEYPEQRLEGGRTYVLILSGSLSHSRSNATNDIINGHKFVDLGLRVKWATMNVGAERPTDYGEYYAWGEIKTKKNYSKNNNTKAIRDVRTNEGTTPTDAVDISGRKAYDAARAQWGASWRMPTYAEFNELRDKCDWKWTSKDGINGYIVTGVNGNSIFLPAAGSVIEKEKKRVNENGNYWSSILYLNATARFFGFNKDNNYTDAGNVMPVFHGLPIRAVTD